MKAPGFWQSGGWQAHALAPFTVITRMATARRLARPGFDAGISVLCAGNASVGGAGKTILARDLLRRLPGAFALTRGYGGRLTGPLLVDPLRHGAADVGDEALLLAATAPTILARDRAAGARLALSHNAATIVMDDGLQNPDLNKSASFLVIDGGQGFGNAHLLPAGPLREPIGAAAARCVAAVMIGTDQTNAASHLPSGLPVLQARLIPTCATLAAGAAVVAFAGIGRPAKFFASATEFGFLLHQSIAFADHHVYQARDEEHLRRVAASHKAQLITTEKDATKLSPAFRAQCHILTVSLAWDDEPALAAILGAATAPRSDRHPHVAPRS